jgi:hypothetical protein
MLIGSLPTTGPLANVPLVARSAGRETSSVAALRATAVRPAGMLTLPSAAVGQRLIAGSSSWAKTAGTVKARPNVRAAVERKKCVRMAQQLAATLLPELVWGNAGEWALRAKSGCTCVISAPLPPAFPEDGDILAL